MEHSDFHYDIILQNLTFIKNEYYCTFFTDSFISYFFLFYIIIYKSKTTYIFNSKGDNKYLPFQKPNKVHVLTNNVKIDINGISDPLEMCKNIILNKSLFINHLEISSHVHQKCITQVLP